MLTLTLSLFAIGLVCMSLEALGVATAFFGIAVLILRFAYDPAFNRSSVERSTA
jgi:hypothetical protein